MVVEPVFDGVAAVPASIRILRVESGRVPTRSLCAHRPIATSNAAIPPARGTCYRRAPPGACSGLRQSALVLALLEGAEEQRLVDPPLEYRHTELHALRDYFAPVHASFSSELGGRQVDRHAFSSLSGNSPLCRSLSCTGCSGRRKLDSANSGCENAEISAKRRFPPIFRLDSVLRRSGAPLRTARPPARRVAAPRTSPSHSGRPR